MKFANRLGALYSLILFTPCLLAQVINIGFPQNGSTVPPGGNITVEVDRPNSLSASQEVAIVIAIQSCPIITTTSNGNSTSTPQCAPPSDILGSILYSGPFDPQFHPNAPGFKPPHQNFTVLVPEAIRQGVAQLSVTHLSLIGAGPAPFLEQKSITVRIEGAH